MSSELSDLCVPRWVVRLREVEVRVERMENAEKKKGFRRGRKQTQKNKEEEL